MGPEAQIYRGLVGPKVQVIATRVLYYLCRHTTGLLILSISPCHIP